MIPISKPYLGEEEQQAVSDVVASGMLAQGPRTAALEERFAAVCDTAYAVATSSGTTALHVALLAHGIGPGDEVITTPFTFIASVNSILFTGARPVLVDIEPDTFNLDPEHVAAAITEHTRAIMPVHLFGYPCNMHAILELARKHDLAVIEDAAQAIGADYQGQRVGSFGTGCFSLYATKNIMSGEGGMITTNDADIAERCKMIRNHGMQRRYYHDMLGYNFRMSDLHAAIGLVQIERLNDFTARRRANAAYFNTHLHGVATPTVRAGYNHVWHQYTIRLPDQQDGTRRDAIVEQLKEAGVGTGIFYPLPAHHQPHLQGTGLEHLQLPVAEQAAREVLSLPVHPHIRQADRETIVREVNRICP
jgi:dTDP-4-amino-4,6-dideoxygalactose transaminase